MKRDGAGRRELRVVLVVEAELKELKREWKGE